MAKYLGVATDTLAGVQSLTMAGSGSSTVTALYRKTVTLSPASVAANTTAEQTFTVPGLAVGDAVWVNKPTLQAGLGIAGARVSAANTLAITFINATASPIVPTASEAYRIGGIR
ncbi:hypothetical protein [Achromobacter aloeverae]|uniref:Uncharacterized protein n=1 Tax=Achromobacter aloeverae TaxID=1750518 RepID=A0A4Q1HIW1_9BURK|nr:hypothetical protein [Achromobacter aloeverae]RXN88017.1 hypothetical protein C7R54_15690 [Achromobacter aloeverae]